MKTINRMVLLLATLFAAIGCSDDDKELVMYSLRFEPNSITLGIGKSYRLVPISDPFYDDVQYEWKSVDERVATVDQSGVVTGVSAGSTEVRAFYGDNRLARCLVSVVESTSSLPDPTAALSKGPSVMLLPRNTMSLEVTGSFSKSERRWKLYSLCAKTAAAARSSRAVRIGFFISVNRFYLFRISVFGGRHRLRTERLRRRERCGPDSGGGRFCRNAACLP